MNNNEPRKCPILNHKTNKSMFIGVIEVACFIKMSVIFVYITNHYSVTEVTSLILAFLLSFS